MGDPRGPDPLWAARGVHFESILSMGVEAEGPGGSRARNMRVSPLIFSRYFGFSELLHWLGCEAHVLQWVAK